MKKLLYLLFAVTLFTACSSDDDNDNKPNPSSKSITVTVLKNGVPQEGATVYVMKEIDLQIGGIKYIGNGKVQAISSGHITDLNQEGYPKGNTNSKGQYIYSKATSTQYTFCIDLGNDYTTRYIKDYQDTVRITF